MIWYKNCNSTFHTCHNIVLLSFFCAVTSKKVTFSTEHHSLGNSLIHWGVLYFLSSLNFYWSNLLLLAYKTCTNPSFRGKTKVLICIVTNLEISLTQRSHKRLDLFGQQSNLLRKLCDNIYTDRLLPEEPRDCKILHVLRCHVFPSLKTCFPGFKNDCWQRCGGICFGKAQQSPVYLLLELINVNLFYDKEWNPLVKNICDTACFVIKARNSFAMYIPQLFWILLNYFQTFQKIWTVTEEGWDVFKMRCYLPGGMIQWTSVQRREF